MFNSSQQHTTFFSSDLHESKDIPIRQSSPQRSGMKCLQGVIAGLVSVGVDHQLRQSSALIFLAVAGCLAARGSSCLCLRVLRIIS